MKRSRWGLTCAVGVAALLAAFPPWREVDEEIAAAARRIVGHADSVVVAVLHDRDDAAAMQSIARRAREVGAVRVIEPAEVVTARPGARAAYRAIDAGSLLDGRVPFDVLREAVVVIDTVDRARARAAASSRHVVPWPPTVARALAAGAIAALLAWGARRPGRGALFHIVIICAAAAGIAALGTGIPFLELGVAIAVGFAGGKLDAGTELRRAVRASLGPILRATALTPAKPESLVNPSLADLFDADRLLLLETPPGARRAAVTAALGAELRADAPLDPTRPPYRDPHGLVRVTDGGAIVAGPSLLVPLAHAGIVEGYLCVAGERVEAAMRAHPPLVAAIASSLARTLRAERLRRRARAEDASLLFEAAHALDWNALPVIEAARVADTGLLLATAAGATLWKNERLGGPVRSRATDLAAALALARRPNERPSAMLERVLIANAPVRIDAGHDLTLTFTPIRTIPGAPPAMILVEVTDSRRAVDALIPAADGR